jgi:FixJ family two-component response regulator
MLLAYAEALQHDAQDREWLAEQVAAVLDTLSPSEHQLLEWFVRGEDDQKVATTLGIKPTTVRWLRHQAYQKFRQQNGGCYGPRG